MSNTQLSSNQQAESRSKLTRSFSSEKLVGFVCGRDSQEEIFFLLTYLCIYLYVRISSHSTLPNQPSISLPLQSPPLIKHPSHHITLPLNPNPTTLYSQYISANAIARTNRSVTSSAITSPSVRGLQSRQKVLRNSGGSLQGGR